MQKIRTAVYGANGRMGKILCQTIATSPDFIVAFGVDREPEKSAYDFPVFSTPWEYEGPIDLLIDFSHPSNLSTILSFAQEKSVATLIATTGLSEEQMVQVREAGNKISILYSPNTSLGINIVNDILKKYASALSDGFDIEIVERHHNLKIDAPSGTAKLFASTISNALGDDNYYVYGRSGMIGARRPGEIGIHAVRGGAICGEHTVLFAGEHELIEIKHTALSKALFAQDALRLCRILIGLPRGMYSIDDIYSTILRRK